MSCPAGPSAPKVRFKSIRPVGPVLRDIAEEKPIRSVADSMLTVGRDSRRRAPCLQPAPARVQRNVLPPRNVQLALAGQAAACGEGVPEVQCAFLAPGPEGASGLLADGHHYQIHLGSPRCLYPPSKSVTGGWESPSEESMSQSAGSLRGPIAALGRTVLLRKIREGNRRARDLPTPSGQGYDRGLGVPADTTSSDHLAPRGEPAVHALACRPGMGVTWLILPVVICLSQRLSHACPSISNYTVKLRMAH